MEMLDGSRKGTLPWLINDFDMSSPPPISSLDEPKRMSSYSESLEKRWQMLQPPSDLVAQWFQDTIVNKRTLIAVGCHGIYCFLTYFIVACILQFSLLHPIQAIFNCFALLSSLQSITYGLLFAIFGALHAALYGFFVLKFDTDDRFYYYSSRELLIYFGSLNIDLSQIVCLLFGSNFSEFSRFFICILIIAHVVASFYNIFRANHRLIFPVVLMCPYLQLDYVIMPAFNNVLRNKLSPVLKWTILYTLICGLPIFGWSLFRNLFDITLYFNTLLLLSTQLFLHQIAIGLIKVFVLQKYEFPMPPPHITLNPTLEQQRTLLNALQCGGAIKAFAFWDLRTFSAACRRRRQIIFSLSQPGGHPRNWSVVKHACLRQIQSLNEKFENENERIRIETLANVSVPLLSSSIVDSENNRPPLLLQTAWQKNGIRHRIVPRNLRKNDTNSLRTNFSSNFSSLKDKLKFLVHTDRHFVSLFEVYIGIIAIESLSTLVCASLNEDRFGVVQKDLGSIVSSLLQFCNNIQKFMRIYKEDKQWQNKTCLPLITSVIDALSRIRFTFPEGSISKRLSALEASFFEKLTSLH